MSNGSRRRSGRRGRSRRRGRLGSIRAGIGRLSDRWPSLDDRVNAFFINKLDPTIVANYEDEDDLRFRNWVDGRYQSLGKYARNKTLVKWGLNFGKNSLKGGLFLLGMWYASDSIDNLSTHLNSWAGAEPVLKNVTEFAKPVGKVILGGVGYKISDKLFSESSKNGEYSSMIAEWVTKGYSLERMLSGVFSLPDKVFRLSDHFFHFPADLTSKVEGLLNPKQTVFKAFSSSLAGLVAGIDVLGYKAEDVWEKTKKYATNGHVKNPAKILASGIGVYYLSKYGLENLVDLGSWAPVVRNGLASSAALYSSLRTKGFWRVVGGIGSFAYLTYALGPHSRFINPITQYVQPVIAKASVKYQPFAKYIASILESSVILGGSRLASNYIEKNASKIVKDVLITGGTALATYHLSKWGLSEFMDMSRETASLLGQYAASIATYISASTKYIETGLIRNAAKLGALYGFGDAVAKTPYIAEYATQLKDKLGQKGKLAYEGMKLLPGLILSKIYRLKKGGRVAPSPSPVSA